MTIQLPDVGDYRIDHENSTVSFDTRHIFGLAAVHGTFQITEGCIHVTEPVRDSSALATIAASSVHTRNSVRDKAVRSGQYLDAKNHPDIHFATTHIEETTEGWMLHGSLTVRGSTRPIGVRVDQTTVDGLRIRLRASSHVDRYEFGITKMKGMTSRRLTVHLDVVAYREELG